MSSPGGREHKRVYLLYMLRWLHKKLVFDADSRIFKAVEFITGFLNTSWMIVGAAGLAGENAVLFHICIPGCFCRRMKAPRRTLVRSFKIIISRMPPIFSEGRWTVASPSAAYFCIWNIIRMLGAFCMLSAFVQEKLKVAMAYVQTSENDKSFDAYKMDVAKALMKTTDRQLPDAVRFTGISFFCFVMS